MGLINISGHENAQGAGKRASVSHKCEVHTLSPTTHPCHTCITAQSNAEPDPSRQIFHMVLHAQSVQPGRYPAPKHPNGGSGLRI